MHMIKWASALTAASKLQGVAHASVMQVSVLTIDTNRFLLVFTQQIRDVHPTAHLQTVGNPAQRHYGLRTQRTRQFDFSLSPLRYSANAFFAWLRAPNPSFTARQGPNVNSRW